MGPWREWVVQWASHVNVNATHLELDVGRRWLEAWVRLLSNLAVPHTEFERGRVICCDSFAAEMEECFVVRESACCNQGNG